MNTYLLIRSLDTESPAVFKRAQCTRLLHALHPIDAAFYARPPPGSQGDGHGVHRNTSIEPESPHVAGVNAITIDKFEGR
jgi:DNA excision repair protein ERCC-8